MRPITTGQNAVNIQYAVLHVAFNVNVDSDLQEQWLVYLPWELWLLLFQRFTGHVFEWWVSWQYFWFYCQVISFVVDLVGRRGCMILGSNLGRPRETPKLEWRCPGLEVEFKTHSCNIYSALMSQGGATFCVGATVQGTCSQPHWFLIRNGTRPGRAPEELSGPMNPFEVQHLLWTPFCAAEWSQAREGNVWKRGCYQYGKSNHDNLLFEMSCRFCCGSPQCTGLTRLERPRGWSIFEPLWRSPGPRPTFHFTREKLHLRSGSSGVCIQFRHVLTRFDLRLILETFQWAFRNSEGQLSPCISIWLRPLMPSLNIKIAQASHRPIQKRQQRELRLAITMGIMVAFWTNYWLQPEKHGWPKTQITGRQLRLESQSNTRRCSILLQLIPGGTQRERLHSSAYVCNRLCFFPARLSCNFPGSRHVRTFCHGSDLHAWSSRQSVSISTSKDIAPLRPQSPRWLVSRPSMFWSRKRAFLRQCQERQRNRRRYKSALETLRRIRGKNDDVRWAFHKSSLQICHCDQLSSSMQLQSCRIELVECYKEYRRERKLGGSKAGNFTRRVWHGSDFWGRRASRIMWNSWLEKVERQW